MKLFKYPKNTRLMSGVLLWAMVFLMQGCAYAPQAKQLEQGGFDRLTIARSVELTAVPYFPQQEFQCGPAALATVLNYRGVKVAPDDLVAKVYVPKRQGSFQIEMISATRQYEKVPYQLNPSLQDLLTEVAAGNPILVLQNLAFESYPRWHFAVVVGYDLNKSQIILRSATNKRWTTTMVNFEQTWRKSNYWAIAVTDTDKIPQTASLSRWLQVTFDLESLKLHKMAEQAYRAAIQHWPSNDKAWLALINLFYKQHRFDEGVQVLNQALLKIKGSAELWNNYAYLLKERGCYQGAQQAAACAVHLKPDDKNILETEQEMQQLELSRSKSCQVLCCNR